MITYPNVLVLDEPTTHLDIPSREALEATLETYDGALLFVSHDRHFINLMADQVWSIEAGTVRPFDGGFTEWMRVNRPPAPEPVSKRARARHRRRERESRKQEHKTRTTLQPRTIDYEALIQKLEANVAKIERRLETASAELNMDEIMRLGQDHARAQRAVDEAWERWGEG